MTSSTNEALLLRVDDDLHQRITRRARRTGRSINATAGEILAHGVSDEALDAMHLATAELAAVPLLEEPGDELGFASRDTAQSEAAAALGFTSV